MELYEFEKLLSMQDKYNCEIDIFCPECGSVETRSIINKTSFSLKGKGWYSDGYTKD